MQFKNLILAVMILFSFLFAQTPNIKINYSGRQPTLQLEGHLRNPQWSVSGNWLGFDFLKEDMISVIFYSVKTGKYKDFAIGEQKSNSISAYAPQMNFSGANTYNVAWVPSKYKDALYVISSLNKKYELFFIKAVRTSSNAVMVYAMSNPETDINLDRKQISYLSFPTANLKEIYGAFIAGNELSSDIWLILRTYLTQITFPDGIRKYDPRLSVDNSGSIKIAYLGIHENQADIFYKPPNKYKPNQNQNIAAINISETPYALEKIPRWSPNGEYLAYLSTEGHASINDVDVEAKEEDVICGLWIYDFIQQTKKEIYYPIGVDPKRDSQNVYAWLPDNQTIILIDYNLEEKQPLIAVNIQTGEAKNLASPYYHHEDIAVSPDGKKLAIIARGHKQDTDFHYTKLYLADIK